MSYKNFNIYNNESFNSSTMTDLSELSPEGDFDSFKRRFKTLSPKFF
jgi:hypothetical protein